LRGINGNAGTQTSLEQEQNGGEGTRFKSNLSQVFIGRIDLVFMINGDKGQTDDHHEASQSKTAQNPFRHDKPVQVSTERLSHWLASP
jgi:hypothetical protein